VGLGRGVVEGVCVRGISVGVGVHTCGCACMCMMGETKYFIEIFTY